jgi:hypothetical protein
MKTSLRVIADKPFGDRARFVAALALDGDQPRGLKTDVGFRDCNQHETPTDARTRRHRGHEANAVEPVKQRSLDLMAAKPHGRRMRSF